MKRVILATAAMAALTAPAAADTLIVGNKAEHTVSFVDLDTGKEVRRVDTGRAPHEIAVSPDGSTAVVVSYAEQGYVGNSLHVFDVATGAKTGVIDLGEHRAPHGLKWIGDSDRVIVTTEQSQDVVIVDVPRGEVVGSLETGMQGSHMVSLSPDLARAYVPNIGSGNFTIFDLESGQKIADIPVGAQSEAVGVDPDGSEVWVSSNGEKKVVRFDAATLEKIGEFDVAGVPIRVEFSPSGDHVAISHFDRAEVIVVDADTQDTIATIDLGTSDLTVPVTMLWSNDGAKLWVAATGSQAVAEIDAERWAIERTFSVGAGSDGLGFSPVDQLPTVTAADFEGLVGTDWAGELSYLNYREPTRSTIPVRLELAIDEGVVKYGLAYPGEAEANNRGDFVIGEDGRSLEGATIVSRHRDGDRLIIVAEKDGEDAEKPARLRFTYSISPNDFSWRKDVRFEGENEFFNRNEFALKR